MRTSIFMPLAATLLSSALAEAAPRRVAPQDSPVALLQAIYGQYPADEAADAWHKADKAWLGAGDVSALPAWETLPLSRDAATLNKRVDKRLKTGEACIDFDQISDSQDPNIAQYKIVAPAAPVAQMAEYQVYIQGSWRKDTPKITYILVKEDGKWRVDNIVTYSKDDKGRPVQTAAKQILKDCLKN